LAAESQLEMVLAALSKLDMASAAWLDASLLDIVLALQLALEW